MAPPLVTDTADKPSSSTEDDGTFTLLLFAAASTYAGGVETLALAAPSTLRGVFAGLEARFPGITRKILRSSAVTVNLEYVDFDLGEEDD